MTQLTPIPSKPPGAEGNLGAVIAWTQRKLMQKTDGMLPAKVIAYSRTANTAVLQPMIAMVSTGGAKITRAQLVAVPVLALGGGGFFINFPLQAGDLGWIEASDRDISLFLQSHNDEIPNSKRMHSFEDARFIPDVFGEYTFAPDPGGMVISSLDGATRIVLAPGKIDVYAATITNHCTDLIVNASNSITMNTAAYNVNATGTGSTYTGNAILPDTTTIGNTPWRSHNHHENGAGSNTNGVNP